MKKKVEKKKVLPEIPKELEVEIFIAGPQDTKPKLSHIELELGREDLNQLRNKINEVIDFINAVK